MGLDTESDSQKSCSSDLSPNSVLPSRQFSDSEKRKKSSKVNRKDDLLTAKNGFTEISFCRYGSASCKTRPLESKTELRRGSVYQSSQEVREMKKIGNDEARRKIELSRESDTSSFSIVDSLCSSDEETTQKKNTNSNRTSVRRSFLEPHFLNGFIEIRPESVKREKQSAERVTSDSVENSTSRCEQVVVPVNDANELLEKDMSLTFHKSLSAKLEIPYSPSPSESDCSSKATSKSRFSPIMKMFDPFMKSKSLRSPLGHISEIVDVKTNGMTNITKNPILRKSLLPDFSQAAAKLETNSVTSSPVHLHGCLKLESKQSASYLKFSLDSPEEVLLAKTWKGNNAFNWVYTFHSIKKSNATIIGQMQVSSFVCSEVKDGNFLDNSVLTEFVLYDIAHGRQSFSSSDELDNDSKSETYDSSNPCPWPSAVLHSDLEIAAVVIQLPIVKRESLKYQSGSNLVNQSMLEQRGKGPTNRESQEKVKVVIPKGNHSWPTDENRGPSSLLDRWRLGGGCDCGGWDMGCPITIFGIPAINCDKDEPFFVNRRPFEIFMQGAKQKLAALTMTAVEEGKYDVDFHAQLSTLQAFSICAAAIHSTEVFSTEEKGKQLPHCNSLKAQFLIDGVTEEEKTKKFSKKTNPTFSPIARV